eukprot:15367205-Ditylum_brightwellii.AAC.1
MGSNQGRELLPFEPQALASKDRILTQYTKGRQPVCTYLGWGVKVVRTQLFLLLTSSLSVLQKKIDFCPVRCWVKMGPATYRKSYPSPGPNGYCFGESNAKLAAA